MTVLQVPFRLPESCIRIAGTRAFARDSVLRRDDVSSQATVTLDVIAESELSTLRLAEGLLVDTALGFEWTDDGRFVTSSVELTGRAGTVAVGAVSAASSIAGAVLAAPVAALTPGGRRRGACRARGRRRRVRRRGDIWGGERRRAWWRRRRGAAGRRRRLSRRPPRRKRGA